MSDLMRPLGFAELMEHILAEYKEQQSILGLPESAFYRAGSKRFQSFFGDALAVPLGPAAGPQTQLAGNLIASYLGGSRFFELKTVQKMDGEEIRKAVAKPCIFAQDEGYNCEWSTELTVAEAFDEYIKAWFAIQVLGCELGLSQGVDFAFNLSVGYDLEGIKGKKIDDYLNEMRDASETPIFRECRDWLEKNLHRFEHFDREALEAISPHVAHSVTISTLHGCPPQEIERIADYLLREKHFDTFIKVNPTLLGYEEARSILDRFGFDRIAFGDLHFREDMQYVDAVPMLHRLLDMAAGLGLHFGIKLSNTCPVDVKRGELPAEEMYMSGRTLHLLSAKLALKLSREFSGKLPISFCAGIDALNIGDFLATGIAPLTVATTLLKPGGYERLHQMAEEASEAGKDAGTIDVEALERYVRKLEEEPRSQRIYRENIGSRKTESPLPLMDCFKAPCEDGGCPIGQNIPEYLHLVAEGKKKEALERICLDNTAPAITGVLCPQPCRRHCTRLDYEDPLSIREMKHCAVEGAGDALLSRLQPAPIKTEKKALVIGAGPAGLAAALFLRRNGVEVTVREKEKTPFGLVTQCIPAFRIQDESVNKDLELCLRQGVEIEYGVDPEIDLPKLREEADFVILALGANGPCAKGVKEGGDGILDALAVLRKARREGQSGLSGRVAVIGGGDVAMDTARLLKREGVEEVHLIYRRARADMPAEQEDQVLALKEGVQFHCFLRPIAYKDGKLKLERTIPGPFEPTGRASILGSGEFTEEAFDAVIAATGASIPDSLYTDLGLEADGRGRPLLSESHESSAGNVYVIGDGRKGPATIVAAIADAKAAARDVLRKCEIIPDFDRPENRTLTRTAEGVYEAKDAAPRGVLIHKKAAPEEGRRCLGCDLVCEICTEVCPNRANVALPLPGHLNPRQIVHIDRLCNECGNCAVFCPHAGRPYTDKWTLFSCEEDFHDSKNRGWLVEGEEVLRRDPEGREGRLPIRELPSDEQGLIAQLRANALI